MTDKDQMVAAALELAKLAEEPLLPELEEWVEEHELFGRSLRSPLVYSVPLMLPGQVNQMYRQKQAALAEALEKKDWHSVIWLHERAYRTWALIEYVVGTNEYGEPLPLAGFPQEVRDLAASVWVDSENLGQHTEEWDRLLDDAEGQLVLADEDEQKEFDELPETLTVYRAGIDDGGWSWTLAPRIAEFFSKRFGANAPMIQGTVDKDDVIGYLTRRGEDEVLVPEGKVHNVRPYRPRS